MRHLKKFTKRYISYIETAVIASVFMVVAVPFVKNISSDKANAGAGEVAAVTVTQNERYAVALNGETIGYVNDEATAKAALLDARAKINSETDGLALVEAELTIDTDANGGAVISQAELAEHMYTTLSAKVTDTSAEVPAYTVRIDDFTVTLASKEDVTELLERVKDKYSNSNEFTVELVDNSNAVYSSLKTNFVSADKTVNEAAKVLASSKGTPVINEAEAAKPDVTYKDGVLSVKFAENIEIIETKADESNIVSVDDAYELITKEHQEKDTYTVTNGDCLSSIATAHNLTLNELLALNEGFTEETLILPGDVIVVTVPASELSVVVVEEASYDEHYYAEVQYVDNPGLYVGTENIIQNPVEGTRSVVALVNYVNGVETGRTIIKENLTKEAIPQIVERGTLEPPTYIKPISWGSISSPYGYRIHPITGSYSLHTGTDWYVPMGTAVKAAASGTVVSAGWNGGYGYCVDIRHNDGSLTRYGHLSSIAVAYGQTVTQGQVVAYSGSTGNSTGPHLHFEIYINGCTVNPVDYVGY